MRALSLDPGRLVMVKQVHGDQVLWAEEAGPKVLEVPADGLITRVPGLALGVRTADCVPVFFWDPARRVAGIAHGGWKGVKKGIIGRMLKAFFQKAKSRPEDLCVAIGPAIRACCYEVGNEFMGYFPGFYRARSASQGVLDLVGVIKDRLLKRGVPEARIEDTGVCTVCQNRDFFSYRAECKTPERILSVISILPS
ncbi:MAG: peptidoglycan editing factor PgeF [Candidatus Omnitrophica bacterium]|nr:peptidoglycan editing factor PgeF [Candidatus Omnitrophota bacterium]